MEKNTNTNELAVRGWGERLTSLVVAFLVILSVTGLWIYLAPFSVAAQIQVILHTVAGIIILGPCVVYQVRHFLVWYRQKLTAVMVLGYLLGAMIIVCLVSGVVLTWQAAVGPVLSSTWDLIHLVTGTAAFALTAAHLLLAFLRRRHAARRLEPLALAMRSFSRQGLSWVGVTTLVVVAVAVAWPRRQVDLPVPADYTLSSYVQEFDEYRGSPFAPTYARTESGMLVDPAVLAGSESCGTSGCHSQILAEWQPSAHRFSAMNPPFQQVQKDFAADRDPAQTRYCAGCHDPISLFAGAKDIQNLDLAAPGMQEGSSCVVCHSISSVDQRGNADYVLTPPHKYIWEGTEGLRKLASDFLIRAYPRQHLADYDRNLLRTPEFCGTCHKQFIPEALNRFGLSPGQNQYDEWRMSHWHTEDPATDLSCRDCHMRLVFDSDDPGRGEAGDPRRSADDGAHRHHGSIATNVLIPEVLKLPHWQEHVKLTKEWISGETVIPEIAELWPAGPVASLDLLGPEEVRAGDELVLRAVVTNRKVGHNFTTGPLDFMRAWVHLVIVDADGITLAEWGNLDPETRSISDTPGHLHRPGNSRQEGTLVLEGMPLDAEGKVLARHELWRKAGGVGQRTIFPRYSDNQIYRFHVPPTARGPLTVHAALGFRRYRQEFLDLVVPTMERDSGILQPTVIQASANKTIEVARQEALNRPRAGGGRKGS